MMSGNTLGATFWTDGHVEAPMLQLSKDFVKCPWCKASFWRESAALVETIHPRFHKPALPREPGQGNDDPCHAPFLLDPDFEDLFLSAARKPLGRPRQRQLRLLAWQAGNHARRNARQPPPLSRDERSNLEALAGLLGGRNSTQRLYAAEAHRQLGDFAEAARLLDTAFPEEIEASALHIRELVSRRDWLVRKYF